LLHRPVLDRALRFPQALWLDLTNPRLVFSFFTLVAANSVFGAGAHLRGVAAAALHLWILALFTWLVLIYFSFGVLAFRNTTHGASVVYGEWLLAIVGTESLVILGVWNLEARRSACASDIFPTALEHRISTRDVCTRQPAAFVCG
jgi:hypothetical protein